MRFFSRRPNADTATAGREPDPAEVIENSKKTIEDLEKRQIHLEKRSANCEAEARAKLQRGDAEGAKQELKRKQMLTKEIEHQRNAQLTLEQQIISMEGARSMHQAIDAMAQLSRANKSMSASDNVKKVDVLMDELQEHSDRQQEITQIFAQAAPAVDDSELTAELDRIAAEEKLKQELKLLDNVPSDALGGRTASTVPSAAHLSEENAAAHRSAKASNDLQEQLKLLEQEMESGASKEQLKLLEKPVAL